MDLGTISTIGVTVGQTLQFNLASQVWQPSQEEMAQGLSDIMCINNLSGVTFQVTLQPSSRQFTLPPGVPTNPIQLSWKGIPTTTILLFVENISSGTFANQVHFDWFAPGEPILYVAASSVGTTGSISVPNVTTNSVTIPTPDNWTMQEDGSGNLDFTDSTTSITYVLGRNGQFTLVGPVEVDTVGPAIQQEPASPSSDMGLWHVKEGTGGAVEWSVNKGHHAGGSDDIYFFDDTHNQNQFAIGPKTQAAIAVVAGQNTVGSFGVPIIVAQTIEQNVTNNATATIVSFTPAANGFYRASFTAHDAIVGNATISAYVTYTDNHGSAVLSYFFSPNANSPFVLNGATVAGPTSLGAYPVTFYAVTSAAITVKYQNVTPTPNDFVSAMIERLA